MTTFRYVFVREPGSRHGELRNAVGVTCPAYLTLDGWCYHHAGAWLAPEEFVVQERPQVSLSLVRLLTQALRHARSLLGAQHLDAASLLDDTEPHLSSERDQRLSA